MSPAEIAARVVSCSPAPGSDRFMVQHWEDWASENPHNATIIGTGDDDGARYLLFDRQRLVAGLVVDILNMCIATIRAAESTDVSEAARQQVIAAIQKAFTLPPDNSN